jgi:hypothetical protein
MVLQFVVDGHTTCFGLYGHLEVCKIFSFLFLHTWRWPYRPKHVVWPSTTSCKTIYNKAARRRQPNLKRYWTIQCNRMLQYNIMISGMFVCFMKLWMCRLKIFHYYFISKPNHLIVQRWNWNIIVMTVKFVLHLTLFNFEGDVSKLHIQFCIEMKRFRFYFHFSISNLFKPTWLLCSLSKEYELVTRCIYRYEGVFIISATGAAIYTAVVVARCNSRW